ncbi:MAG: chemotaxis protein CheA [Pirellulales bacterium]
MDPNLLSAIWEYVVPALNNFSESPEDELADEKALKQSDEKDNEPAKKDAATKKAKMIRINEDRLEGVLDEVSNLFITCERFKDVQQRMSNRMKADSLVEELRQITLTLSSQTNGLQTSVAVLRKVPIRGLFSKFPKMARSLAEGLGKNIDVHLSGEDNEVDKSLLEDLDAPLAHMIRNVADHALEIPEERIARGVPEIGNLWLSAETTRTHIVITIRDDGRGIDPHKLKSKAVEKGVISDAQANQMSDQEAIQLVFHPGFSTAEKITDISGRGVGMDVVYTTIREYDGEIHLESEVNVGSTFTIELPIRQAVLVLDGLLLEQGNTKYVLPFESIVEVLEIEDEEIHSCQGDQIVSIRGENHPAKSLSSVLGIEETFDEGQSTKPSSAVLITSKSGETCLFVDEILSKRKVVVNSLQNILPGLNRVSGVAQLGGGELALVLNAQGIVRSLTEESSRTLIG